MTQPNKLGDPNAPTVDPLKGSDGMVHVERVQRDTGEAAWARSAEQPPPPGAGPRDPNARPRAPARSVIGNSPTPFSLFTGQTFGKGDRLRPGRIPPPIHGQKADDITDRAHRLSRRQNVIRHRNCCRGAAELAREGET